MIPLHFLWIVRIEIRAHNMRSANFPYLDYSTIQDTFFIIGVKPLLIFLFRWNTAQFDEPHFLIQIAQFTIILFTYAINDSIPISAARLNWNSNPNLINIKPEKKFDSTASRPNPLHFAHHYQ